jgi:hypothetical protein
VQEGRGAVFLVEEVADPGEGVTDENGDEDKSRLDENGRADEQDESE